MKKISSSIPTIIQNKKLKKQYNKKEDTSSSVVIFQHNNLIEARYSLTLQEKRLILWLISKIQPQDESFKKHELTVKEFMNLLEVTGKDNYKELQKITLGLMKKVLIIKRPEEKTLTQVNWINYAHYEEGAGRIELAFSEVMTPFLLHLKNQFTAIEVTDLMQFKSIHAIRIYELLKQYENIGERILTIEEIKECCGVKDKFKNYPDLERYILFISQREINAKSDIHIEFERMKEGRKIVSIKFLISKNKAYELRNNPIKEIKEVKRKPPVVDIMKEFGLSTKVINQILKTNKEQAVQDAIRSVDLQIERGNVRNPRAMLMTAIKEKWHPEKFKTKDSSNPFKGQMSLVK
jgi:plasmid replication initiation protein